MREIKFRSWNSNLNRMSYSEEILQIGFQYSVKRNSFSVLNLTNGNDVDEILMQFTGRYDIHGKEIYEGDIVIAPYHQTFVIKWFNELYWDGAGSSHPGFWVQSIYRLNNDNDCDMEYHDSFHNLIIVGNIYENPDLLKIK